MGVDAGGRNAARAASRPAGTHTAPRRTRWSGAARPKISEYALHRAVAEMLDWSLAEPACWTTFPAGWGKMTPAMAGMLYSCGLKKGMPDILIFHDRRTIGIELKTPGRAQSSVQRAMSAKLMAARIRVYVARSVDEVLAILKMERLPLKNVRLL